MDASQQYFENAVTTQQRGKLIVMLYEGAVKYLKIVKEKLREGDYALKGIYISKTQDIVSELNNCLNVEAAPEIANDLRAIYNFIHRTLSEANIERSEAQIDVCIGILNELREAWEEVAERVEEPAGASGARTPVHFEA